MDFGNYKKTLFERKPQKGIYRHFQEIAESVCNYFGDTEHKDFGRWIGYMKRHSVPEFMSKFEFVKEKGIRNPHYLSACFRKKAEI